MLEAMNLTKEFDGRKVVDQISFNVETGEIVGLLGRNGAGKSTTFKMTIGMLKPDRGEVHLMEEDATHLPMYKRAQKGLGYLSQHSSLLNRLSVWKNLQAVLETQDMDSDLREARVQSLLEEFDIDHLAEQKAGTLSGGEKRRLEICRVLAISPRIILLDEPFSGVDPIAVGELQDLVSSLINRDIGILLTDHNVRETLEITDRSYIIDNGQIIAHGTVDEIMNNELVRKVYLGEDFTM